MEELLKRLEKNPILYSSVKNCETQITPILQQFITNFPEFTDHSINHSKTVLGYAENLLSEAINKLNDDEVYILVMGGLLHDIGMCPTSKMKTDLLQDKNFIESGRSFEDYLRDVHHQLSYQYVTTHWKTLHIINEVYAEAIALVGMGHRVVNLRDFELYEPEYTVRSGKDFVCLPYLASILRLADELDITNDRTPELLYNEYFPVNRISKKEWEKHKANYFVNFIGYTIKITSKCYEKDLYYALLKQYNKIDDVLKYVQKVISTIPQNNRGLTLEYNKLEKDVKTYGFIPKEIGFSFDLQNTIDTFIGENIYRNKYVAIRECLQNAIDTCRLRNSIEKNNYTPEIIMEINGNKLVISDNGLGMDEFIVENYFAKLAKSYYSEQKVADKFEAISQFGIGVFSYFLLCNFFDVETKKDSKSALHFRVTKDANNYFHFFENPTRNESGTTITVYLIEPLDFEELTAHVKHYIRFVEFPIIIKQGEQRSTVNAEQFEIDKSYHLQNLIKRTAQEKLQLIETVEVYLNTSDFEGIVALLLERQYKDYLCPVTRHELFDSYNMPSVEISQKGIYIDSIRHFQLQNVLGKINFKRKNAIDIGRYHIKDRKHVDGVANAFLSEILRCLFTEWKQASSQDKFFLTTKLLDTGFSDYVVDVSLLESFHDDIYVMIYKGEVIEYVSITEALKMDSFILAKSVTPFDRDIDISNYAKDIYEEFNLSMVLQGNGRAAYILLQILEAKGIHVEIITGKRNWYYLLKSTQQSSKQKLPIYNYRGRYRFDIFDTNMIAAYPNLLLEESINLKHHIIRYYYIHLDDIKNNKKLYRSYGTFFHELANLIYSMHSRYSETDDPKKEIAYLNSILDEINVSQGTNFSISSSDFPEWVNKLFIS